MEGSMSQVSFLEQSNIGQMMLASPTRKDYTIGVSPWGTATATINASMIPTFYNMDSQQQQQDVMNQSLCPSFNLSSEVTQLIAPATASSTVSCNDVPQAFSCIGRSSSSSSSLWSNTGTTTPPQTSPNLEDVLIILQQEFNLKPKGIGQGGSDFFSLLTEFLYGERTLSKPIRESIAKTIGGCWDLCKEAETLIHIHGGGGKGIEDYLLHVRENPNFTGSVPEMIAATRCYAPIHIILFEVDGRQLLHFVSPPSSASVVMLPQREVYMLHYRGYFWLLEPSCTSSSSSSSAMMEEEMRSTSLDLSSTMTDF